MSKEKIGKRVIPVAGAVLAGVFTFAAPAPAEAAAASGQAAPVFQMPFFTNQTWRASTYDGHYPNQNSIDLMRVGSSSQGAPVVASAGGTVRAVGEVFNDKGENFGEAVYLSHGNGWETHYLHIETDLVPGTVVVRGQHLGIIGKYLTMAPHLHYTQLHHDAALRVVFNGTAIQVHKAAPKDVNGNYPTQNLTSKNTPSNCVVTGALKSASVSCGYGAAARVVMECQLGNGFVATVRGPFVAAKRTSSTTCTGVFVLDRWFETT